MIKRKKEINNEQNTHLDRKQTLTFREWPPRVRLAVSGSETGCEWE